jgi:hypothetical protein
VSPSSRNSSRSYLEVKRSQAQRSQHLCHDLCPHCPVWHRFMEMRSWYPAPCTGSQPRPPRRLPRVSDCPLPAALWGWDGPIVRDRHRHMWNRVIMGSAGRDIPLNGAGRAGPVGAPASLLAVGTLVFLPARGDAAEGFSPCEQIWHPASLPRPHGPCLPGRKLKGNQRRDLLFFFPFIRPGKVLLQELTSVPLLKRRLYTETSRFTRWVG